MIINAPYAKHIVLLWSTYNTICPMFQQKNFFNNGVCQIFLGAQKNFFNNGGRKNPAALAENFFK